MNRVKITDNFYLDEFIDPSTYISRGEKSIQLIDMRIVYACQYIRDHLGAITVNNWAKGGQFKESGLRSPFTKTGAKFSQHKYGRAADIKVAGKTPAEVHAFIKANEQFFIERQWITTMEELEDTPTWTHIDCRFTGLDHLLIVSGK